MGNEVGVGSNALQYRIVTKGLIGLIGTFFLTLPIYFVFLFLGVSGAMVYFFLLYGVIYAVELLGIILISHLEVRNLKYRIDQNSITLKRGIFSTVTETIPFAKVKNSRFDQTFIQSFFSVGDIDIDQDDEQFYWSSIDVKTANLIRSTISAKSNIQPITLSTVSVTGNKNA